MTPKRILPVALFAALLVVPTARAQDEPVLPDLTPREVEIRGELTIRFPSLRRQPLVGFNPPPRIPDIAADRRPFAEPYKQERADLPLSPLRTPTAPAVASYLDGPVFVGQVEGGVGRYTERFILADLAARPGSALHWTVDGSYRGRTGFEAYPEAEARYEQGSFAAQGVAPLGGIDIGASMEGLVSNYALYGVVPTFENLDAPLPERDVRGGTVGALLGRNRGTVRVKLEGALGASSIRTDVAGTDGSLERGAEREDRTTSLGGSLETVGQTLGVWLAADYAKTTPVEDSTPSAAADRYSAGGGVRLEVGRVGRLSAGVRVLGVGRDALSELEDDRSFSYLSPDVRLDAAIGPNLRLEVSQRPGTTSARLRDLYGEQPYLVDSPVVEPEIWPVDAKGRLTAALGSVELALAAGYRRSPNRRYFEHDPTNVLDFVRGISTARHGKSSEADAAVDVIGYFGPSVQAGIGATVRSARLTELDTDVPYVAPWTLRSLISAALLDGRGLVQVTMRVEGPRDRDLAGSLELPAFADLDFLASYRVTRNASVVFRLDNVGGNRPEWDRYLRPSAVYTAGVAWEW
jgi:hypothetical protein